MTRLIVATRAGAALFGLAVTFGATGAGGDVVAVVSATSPVTTISKNEALDIFLGKTSRFPDGSPAVPLDLVEGSASRDEFYLQFASKSPAQIKAYWSKIIFTGRGQPPREVANGAELKRRLAANPNGIGYLSRDLVDSSVRVVLAP